MTNNVFVQSHFATCYTWAKRYTTRQTSLLRKAIARGGKKKETETRATKTYTKNVYIQLPEAKHVLSMVYDSFVYPLSVPLLPWPQMCERTVKNRRAFRVACHKSCPLHRIMYHLPALRPHVWDKCSFRSEVHQ